MSEQSAGDTEQPIHPLEKLRQAADKAEDRADKELVHCPVCETRLWKESVEKAIETAENHDEKRHGGERTTKVNGMLPPSDEVAETIEETIRSLRTESDR